MAEIKSALELALERTKDIKGDKEALDAKEYRERGMKLVTGFENDNNIDVKKEISTLSDKQRAWLNEGIKQVLATYLNLPSNEASLERLKNVQKLFVILAQKPRDMEQYLGQLIQFFSQFLQQREQMIEALRQQAEPSLRQKEEALYKQTGRRVRLTVETDPELSKYLGMNLDKLTEQYEQALGPVRGEVLGLLG